MKNFSILDSANPTLNEKGGRRLLLIVSATCVIIIVLALMWLSFGGSTILIALLISVCFAIFGLSFIILYRRTVEERHRKLEEARKSLEVALAGLTAEKNRSDKYFDFLAHDMANLLAPLMSYGVMISSHPTAPAEIKRYSRKIVEQTDRAARFITNMRRLLEAEEISPITPPAYDLSSNLKVLEDRLRKENLKKRISFKANMPENQQVTVVGGEFVDDILFTVLQNSAKHTKSDEVRIAVMISPLVDNTGMAFWNISIEDEGPGIPDSRKTAITSPFETSQKSAKGIGSTLSFMSAIAKHFGGRMWIEDRVPGTQGKGTRVVISMPCAVKN